MRERNPPTSVSVSVKKRSAVNEHPFAIFGDARPIAAEMGVRTLVARPAPEATPSPAFPA